MRLSRFAFAIVTLIASGVLAAESDSFVRYSDRPILTATQYWEEQAVFEPTVIQEDDGTFTMFYSGGGSTLACAMGMAKSTDGINWVKNPTNPVLGQGRGGLSHACRNFVRKVNGVYHAYVADGIGGPGVKIWFATSTDGRLWSVHPTPAFEPNGWAAGIANTFVYDESNGSICMFYDSLHATNGQWQIGRACAYEPQGPFINNVPEAPFSGLGAYTFGGMHVEIINGVYHMWYHGTPDGQTGVLPSDIFHATSTDVLNWTRSGTVLAHAQNDWEWDQAADPFILRRPELGQVWMYYDGDDNRANGPYKAAIGLAIRLMD